MKIISWNINGIRAWYKKDSEINTFSWFLKQSPDFFCVQETKAHPEQLPDSLLEIEDYFAYFDHSKEKKGYSGVAIYTKHEPEKVEYGFGDEDLDKEGRMLSLFYEKFVLINCYFPNGGMGGDKFKFKLRFFDAFLKYILKLRKKGYDVIFVGDVNVAHTELDILRAKENENTIGFLPEERAWVSSVIENGFVDSWRSLYQKTEKYSWWDMKTRSRDRNVGWRIDYIFVSENIASNIKKAEIHNDVYGSDHCPVSLEIDF
ncbi:MAG: Exodeoxyribonuclease exodeoxyribonuclease [Bacteroidota bacterium]|jgi:exodeoxyribonuclease-3